MADDSLHDHPGPVVDETAMATLEVLDDGTLDWGRVTKTTFLAHHVLRYVYPGPIQALRHRLMVIPPASLGDQVEAEIRFEAWAVAERCAGCPPATLSAGRAADLGLTSPSRRTEPDQALADAAAELAAAGPGGLDLAERAADWTSRAFIYGHGTTTVATTAAQSLAGGRGVCQDSVHVLLSILRTAGLAARTCPGTCSARAAPTPGSRSWSPTRPAPAC
ncbi:MAG TPA: transglutaminase family protein [Actinomycetota bacterium]